tara:strand:+ start:101 stop:499 length:399 start_codon:yes stop_codon:yes gene_type:complete
MKRNYIAESAKAALHPLRDNILRLLKEADRSTVELEALTGENRYNLYHHLEVLLKSGLAQELETKGRARVFGIIKPKKPEAAVLLLDQKDKARKPKEWEALLETLEDVEGERIPHKRSVRKIQVQISYTWSE